MFKKLSTNMEDSMHFHQTSMDSVLITTLHNRLRRESSERGIKFLFADAKRPFFASGGQSIGASASTSILPVNIQG